MRFLTTILLVLCIGCWDKADAQETFYFDEMEKPVVNKNEAAYYRTIDKTGKQFIVKDFFRNGKIRRLAFCIATQPTLIFDGSVFWFSPRGFLVKEGSYANGIAHGLFREFSRNGQAKLEYLYHGDKKYIYNYWSFSGQQLLENGNGIINDFDSVKNETNHVVILDSLMQESFVIRHAKADTVYTLLDHRPEYKGGLHLFYSEIAENLVYPTSARRHGIQGKVLVKFVIGKNGSIEDATVLEGLREDCDIEAKRAIENMNVKWVPGKFKNKFVKSSLVLPVFFKLT